MQERIISPNFLGKIFGAIDKVAFSTGTVSVYRKNNDVVTLDLKYVSDVPRIKAGFFGGKISLKINDQRHQLTFLSSKQTKNIKRLLENVAKNNIADRIKGSSTIFRDKALGEYLRDSSIESLEESVGCILDHHKNAKTKWSSFLAEEELSALQSWQEYFPLSAGKEKLRKNYESSRLIVREQYLNRIESNPLTDQQRLSVIRNNDLNLVLAAAGTGKTSVIVAKALDLIDSGVLKSSEILILAYNKAAAKELKCRIAIRGEACGVLDGNEPNVSTFHALGRKILKSSDIPVYLSVFSEDPVRLKLWVSQWLEESIKSSPEGVANFLELQYQPVNPFGFTSKEAYDAYVRDNEYRTLQGERVKGYQELLIANWFFLNSVEYTYEAPYVSKRRVEVGIDYKPDFHLKGTTVYLEHFGIDRDGNTRRDIDKKAYNGDIQSKRKLHKENNTTLVETYHYDWTENKLENRLETLMAELGIELTLKTSDEIFDVINKLGMVDQSANRYLKCLQAVRVERLDELGILERLNANNIVNADRYTELLSALHTDYQAELEIQKCIDFDDMIIRSTMAVSNGSFKPRWKHILVDEFQDISEARMDFLRSLVSEGPNPVLTVVGDDWQSIYRFSGGKLELTTRFEELVGSHSLTKLEKTFRYNNSIADTAGEFVMQNPEQYKKNVTTHTVVSKSQVYLLDSKIDGKSNLEERALQVINTIRENDPNGSIAVLARYRYLLGNAKEKINNESKHRDIKFWTFHGSKGLEADYCVLIGFFQGKSGFPNMNKEEAVVEALLPSLDSFPHSEERRLLYVGITRAKKKSYLIADPMAPSVFVSELLSPKYRLHIASKTFEDKYREIFKCPVCTDGFFRVIEGKFGNFYSCTSGQVCASKPRICEKCGSPSMDGRNKSVCNNIECREEKTICQRCGRPMKLREGKFGKFYGCTGYGVKSDRCKNTRKYFA